MACLGCFFNFGKKVKIEAVMIDKGSVRRSEGTFGRIGFPRRM